MHFIQQHTLAISCTSTEFGKEVQAVVASILEKELYPKLELLLNLYSVKDIIWKIEKLEITLPKLTRKNWKKEIVTHSLDQIETYLKTNFDYLEQKESTNEPVAILFSKETIAENLFFDFLKKGIILDNGVFKTPDEVSLSIMPNALFIAKLKAFFIQNPDSLVRFIVAFPKTFREKIAHQIDDLHEEFKAIVGSLWSSNTLLFSSTALESWVEFMAWQFYFFKVKALSNAVLYHTFKTITPQYWNLESNYLLPINELVSTKNSLAKKHILLQNNDFIVFWNTIVSAIDSLNTKEKLTHEEIQTANMEQKTEQETPNSKTENRIYIENAGLILFHPFLKPLFEQLNLTKNDLWTTKISQHKAILLTQFLIKGETKIGENELVLNKILCGFAIENVVNTQLEITQKEIEKCESLLQAVIEHWKILGDTSIAGLRETFLQREGKILFTENEKLELWVKQNGVDILLAQLPWGIEMIKTPWMKDFLQCYWN